MKVIGHTGTHTVMLEAEASELARLLGFNGVYSLPRVDSYDAQNRPAQAHFPVGKTIEVNELWKIIEHERGRPGAIKMAAGNLHALASMLESVNAMLPTPPTDAAEGA